MYYAYLDESGNTAPFQAAERFLVVAVIVSSQATARALERHMKRLRKTCRAKDAELKAKAASPRVRQKLLKAIAGGDLAVVAIVLDKRAVIRQPEDPEDWYRAAVARAARQCAQYRHQLKLVIDKRYTSKTLRNRLEAAIRGELGSWAHRVTIEHLDSRLSPCLQVADYVAWAIRTKYEAGDSTCYDLIKGLIVSEQVIEAK